MLALERKMNFLGRYHKILEETLKPDVINIDENLIWKRFRGLFGLKWLKYGDLKGVVPEILKKLTNDEIYRAILKSCGSIIKEML
jgi:hypothetical protein